MSDLGILFKLELLPPKNYSVDVTIRGLGVAYRGEEFYLFVFLKLINFVEAIHELLGEN